MSGEQSQDTLPHRMSGEQSQDTLPHRMSGEQTNRSITTEMNDIKYSITTHSNIETVTALQGTPHHKTKPHRISTIHYLKVTLKDVLPRALHEVCQTRPSDPIEFLAKYLYKAADCELYFHEKTIFSRDMQLMALQVKRENEKRQSAIVKLRKQIQDLKLIILKHQEIESSLWLRPAPKDAAAFVPLTSESGESEEISPKIWAKKRKSRPRTKSKTGRKKPVPPLSPSQRHLPRPRKRISRLRTRSVSKSLSPVAKQADITTVIQGSESEGASRRSSATVTSSERSSVFHVRVTSTELLVSAPSREIGSFYSHGSDEELHGKEVEVKDERSRTRREAGKVKKPHIDGDQRSLEKRRPSSRKPSVRRGKKAEEKEKLMKQVVSPAPSPYEDQVGLDAAAVPAEAGEEVEEVQVLKVKPEKKKKIRAKKERELFLQDESGEEKTAELGQGKEAIQDMFEDTTLETLGKDTQLEKVKKKKKKKDLQQKREDEEDTQEILEEEEVAREGLEEEASEILEEELQLKKAKRRKTKKDLHKKREDEEDTKEILKDEEVAREGLEEEAAEILEEELQLKKVKRRKTKKDLHKKREDEEDTQEILEEEAIAPEVLEEEAAEILEIKKVKKEKRRATVYKSVEDEYLGDAEEKESLEEAELSSQDSRSKIVRRAIKKKARPKTWEQKDFDLTGQDEASEVAQEAEATTEEARVEEPRKRRKKRLSSKKREDGASVDEQPQLDAERPDEDLHTDYDTDEDTFQRTEEDIRVETSEHVLAKTKKRRSKKLYSEDWSKIDVQQSEDEQEAPSKLKKKKRSRKSTSVLKSGSFEEDDMEEYDQDRDLEPKRRMKIRSKKADFKYSEDEDEASVAKSLESLSSVDTDEDAAVKAIRKQKPRKKGARKKADALEEVPDSRAEQEVVGKAPSEQSVRVSESLHVSVSSLRHEETEVQFTPMECQWSLVGPRVLVCRHPVLGEIRSQPPSIPAAQDFRFWSERSDYEWHSFYDPELYTVEEPSADDGRYKRLSKINKRSAV